jgi:hypothetical protein
MDMIDKTLFHKVVEEMRNERYSILTNLSILTFLKEDKKTGGCQLTNAAGTYVTQTRYTTTIVDRDYSLNVDTSFSEEIAVRALTDMFSDLLTEAFLDKLQCVIASQNKPKQRIKYFENLDIDIDQITISLEDFSVHSIFRIGLNLTERLLNNLYEKTAVNNGRVKIHVATNRIVGLSLLINTELRFCDDYSISISEHDYFKDKILVVPSYEYVDQAGTTISTSFANSVVNDLTKPNDINSLKGFLTSIINIPTATIVNTERIENEVPERRDTISLRMSECFKL